MSSEFQVFNWASMGARIRSKRVFLCWFVPVVFLCVWGLTFSVPTYYTCTTSLSTEEVRVSDEYRAFMLNRPENFDLGLSPLRYSIAPEDYDELVGSTEFLCRVLAAPVKTQTSVSPRPNENNVGTHSSSSAENATNATNATNVGTHSSSSAENANNENNASNANNVGTHSSSSAENANYVNNVNFEGTYYQYLATQYRYPFPTSLIRAMNGTQKPDAALPELDPFYPRGMAAEAIKLAGKSIGCNVDRQTKLTTLTVTAQDPLVAALVAQAATQVLKQMTSEYYRDKSARIYEHLQEQITYLQTEYEQALQAGDDSYAQMLAQAQQSFTRQAIVLNAQLRYEQTFTTLNNVSVPIRKAGPHHLSIALVATMLIALLALAVICRRELF